MFSGVRAVLHAMGRISGRWSLMASGVLCKYRLCCSVGWRSMPLPSFWFRVALWLVWRNIVKHQGLRLPGCTTCHGSYQREWLPYDHRCSLYVLPAAFCVRAGPACISVSSSVWPLAESLYLGYVFFSTRLDSWMSLRPIWHLLALCLLRMFVTRIWGGSVFLFQGHVAGPEDWRGGG